MRDYKIILKLLLKDIFKKRQKKQTLIITLLAIFYLMISIYAVLAVVLLAPTFLEHGKQAELITIILFIDFVLTVVFGLLSAMNYLFMSKDSEFFKALPVKQTKVFLAKLTIVYLTEALLSTALLTPALIFAGIFLNLPALFYLLIPVFIIVVPIFALAFIALLSMPLMYIISLFKNRGLVSSIALIIVFGAGFSLYMVGVMSFTSSAGEEMDLTAIIGIAGVISNIFYPVLMLARLAAMQSVFGLSLAVSMLIEAGIFLVSLAAIFALSYFLCAMVYARVTSKLLENGGKKTAKNKKYVASGTVKAIIKTELRNITRNPTVAMQVVSGIILCPLMVILFCMMFGNMATMFSTEEYGLSVDLPSVISVMGVMAIMMLGVGANAGANTCISREGKSINLIKSLPILPETIIKAKRITYFIISAISIVTGFAALMVMMIINDALVWWLPLIGVPSLLIWLWAVTSLSIYIDLRSPKFDFKSFRELMKRAKNNLFSIVWILSSSILCSILFSFVLAGLVKNAQPVLGISLGILGGLGAVAAYIFHKLLNDNTAELFKKLNS